MTTVRTTARVNLRQGPGTSFEVVVVIPTGTTGVITGPAVVSGGYTWLPVSFPGLGSGYMAENYLDELTPTPANTVAPPTHTPGPATNTPLPSQTPTASAIPAATIKTSARVNLRQGPGTGFSVVAVVPSGAMGVVTGAPATAGGYTWYLVSFPGYGSGYMADQYFVEISTPTATRTATSTPVPPTSTATTTATMTPTVTNTPSITTTPSITRTATVTSTPTTTRTVTPGGIVTDSWVKTTTRVNLRSGPGTGFSSIGVLDSGTVCQVTGNLTVAGNHSWYPVSCAGFSPGYVSGSYLTLTTAPPAATPTRTPTAIPAAFPIGSTVRTTANVNIRSTPSTSGAVLGVFRTSQTATITGAPVAANGYIWYPVTVSDIASGWVISNHLKR